MSLRHSLFAISALAATAALVGCHNDDLSDVGESTAPVATGDTIALTSTGRVVSFNRAPSAQLISSKSISGLPAGESLISVDTRPANKLFYALSSKGIIYLLDPSTGIVSTPVTLVANTTTPTTAGCTPAVSAYTALSGTEFGTDFNPSVDRLRIVSDTGQNLRVNVDNGMTTVDCGLTAGTATVKASAAAYTNSVSGVGPQSPAQATSLYYIDASNAMLYTTTAPNNGTLTAVGSLGVTNVSAVNGFDISTNVTGGTNSAYATLTGTTVRNGVSVTATSFYSVNLGTGAATVLADFAENFTLRGLALK